VVTSKQTLRAETIILTTGGQSYPSSGSTGDGYRWAAELGHTILPLRPALVPVTSRAPWVLSLQGITMPDISVRVLEPGDGAARPICLAQRRSSLLFSHFGGTGPAVLDISRAISGHAHPQRLVLRCDLLPDRRTEILDAELQEDCRREGRRLAVAILGRYVPQRLAETIAARADIDRERRASEVSRDERQRLVTWLKQFDIPVSGTLGFNKAEVTAGGVALDEVDSRTMQSRLVPGLFFAGEILDIDGPLGGYNFQAAFSTGWLAGDSA